MAKNELVLRAGYWLAPWSNLLIGAGALFLRAGVPEGIVFAAIIPLSGLAWTQIGSQRRRYHLMRPS